MSWLKRWPVQSKQYTPNAADRPVHQPTTTMRSDSGFGCIDSGAVAIITQTIVRIDRWCH